ncbi:MAG: HD domain-containing protein [Clostridiales bacterium]|nr:HD domain-containing protein [Clostridiales bacterium]
MNKGTILKSDYIEKLKELGIGSLYIEENEKKRKIIKRLSKEEVDILRLEIKEECKIKVKAILEKHVYKKSHELASMCEVAEDIIGEILVDENISDKIIEVKAENGDLYSHLVNVCGLATLLALKLGEPIEFVKDIATGCLLHDIGFRFITVPYLDMEINTLSKNQQEEYRKHVIYGYDSLQNEEWITTTQKDIILFHHEMENGSGYPLKLGSTQIPRGVKIVNVCNAFDELISGVGCKGVSLQEAIEFIRINKKIMFDADVAEEFLKMIVEYPVGDVVKTNEGEVGRVIRQNKSFMDRPVLKVIKDTKGNIIGHEKEVDLLKLLSVFIVEVLDE